MGAAEFFVTNSIGGGPVAGGAFGATTDQGLRTLAGGQFSIQVEGYLAIQTDAAPPLIVRGFVRGAGYIRGGQRGSVRVGIWSCNCAWVVPCTARLTIADGLLTSNVVDGFGLVALAAGSQLSLDVVSVPTAASSLPGSDLTVIIRL